MTYGPIGGNVGKRVYHKPIPARKGAPYAAEGKWAMRYQTRIRNIVLMVALSLIPCSISTSQTPEGDLVNQAWKAWWITHPDGPQREFGVFHFRKTFTLESVPQRFVIHVSGDNRYELFVNGERVLAGPARGDLNHWRYETLDIAPHLAAGQNALAAVLWNFAELAPQAQMTNETGLIVQGDSSVEEIVNTDNSWKVFKSQAVRLIRLDAQKIGGYLASGPGEQVDGSKYPWGWEARDFDDSGWVAATPITAGGPRGIKDTPSRWMLIPRTIPLMEDKLERFSRVARASGLETPSEFLQGARPVTLPANSRASLLFDQSYLTTGYPELVTSGGRGANITLTYAEALYKGTRKRQSERNRGEGNPGYRGPLPAGRRPAPHFPAAVVADLSLPATGCGDRRGTAYHRKSEVALHRLPVQSSGQLRE